MKGNFHVQFLGEGVAATSPPPDPQGSNPPGATRPFPPLRPRSGGRLRPRSDDGRSAGPKPWPQIDL